MNGPAVEVVLTVMSSWSLQPPPEALSRTVTLKFIVLVTEGITSQVNGPPESWLAIVGKYLVGLVEGEMDLKLGPPVAVATGAWVEISLFICSQQ